MKHKANPNFYNRYKLNVVQSDPRNVTATSKMLLQSWHDSYADLQPGVTHEWIDDQHKENSTAERIKEFEDTYRKFASDPQMYLSLQVVDSDSVVVGFINANKENNQQELAGLYVSEEMKGTGLADELMERFYDWHDPSKDTILWVMDGNGRATSFYQRHGFEVVEGSQKPHREGSPLTIMKMIRRGDLT